MCVTGGLCTSLCVCQRSVHVCEKWVVCVREAVCMHVCVCERWAVCVHVCVISEVCACVSM